jgi:hypothetical protein
VDRNKKKFKRRGEDPRLDALADELARMDREETERGEEGEPKEAPALIMAGGVDAAKVHVAGIAPPEEIDHATFERKKVVIEEARGRGRRGEVESRGNRVSGRVIARWKMVSLMAAGVAVVSLLLTVRVWMRTENHGREGAAAGDAGDIRSEPVRPAPSEAMSAVAVPSVELSPTRVGAPSSSAEACTSLCPSSSGTEVVSPPSAPTSPLAGTTSPSATLKVAPMATAAPSAASVAPTSSAVPGTDKATPELKSPEF